jgi:phage repressor protein C with HTH and peptisase S24 domain
MEANLHDGDLVVINTDDVTPKDGVVFAANYDGELVIKRLKRDAGQWFLASDNPDKARFGDKLCADGCGLIGRIVYKQSEQI